MIRQMLHSLFMLLPADERMRVATWRFARVRESFYTETRLESSQGKVCAIARRCSSG